MAADGLRQVLYWDASALVSVFVADAHSQEARRAQRSQGRHLVSSLAFAEVCAVLARLVRDKATGLSEANHAVSCLLAGPWDQLTIEPDRRLLHQLARKHALRGADLWHLATAETLRQEIDTVRMITYDKSLKDAARAEALL